MAKKLFVSDSRMLALMKWAVEKGFADTESAFLEAIGCPRQQISNIRTGHQGFTKHHILAAAKLTGANLNWIYGLEDNMLRKQTDDVVDRLEIIVTELREREKELPKKVPLRRVK